MAGQILNIAGLKKEWREGSMLHRVWMALLAAPAACVFLLFPLMPNVFEAMSIQASGLLDIIELGRGRPWVLFMGLPYPATLRLFGDVSGVMAVLLLIIHLIELASFGFFYKSFEKQFKDPDYYSLVIKKGYYIGLCSFLLMSILFLYVGMVHFILPAPIEVAYPLQFAWHVCLASFAPCGLLLSILFTGYVLYFRIFVV